MTEFPWEAQFADLLAAERRRRLAWEEAEVHRMCAAWVSGLEPTLARDRHGNLLGLTHDCDLGVVGTIAIQAAPYPGEALGGRLR